MKTTQPAAYDVWFHQEVKRALQEANDTNTDWGSQEEVKRQSAIRRTAWRSNAATLYSASQINKTVPLLLKQDCTMLFAEL